MTGGAGLAGLTGEERQGGGGLDGRIGEAQNEREHERDLHGEAKQP